MSEAYGVSDFLTDITPFAIYYLALFVRIFDNRDIFISLFLKKPLDCDKMESEGCPLNWENPMAKAHHEFIFTNISVSFIILMRYIFNLYFGSFVSISNILLSLFYMFFSISCIFIGLKLNWKGIDSIFFSLILMSVPFYTIFSLSNFNPFILILKFPAFIAVINFVIILSIAIYQHFFI